MENERRVLRTPDYAFLAWRRLSLEDPDFDIGFICNEFGGGLTDAEVDALRAPSSPE